MTTTTEAIHKVIAAAKQNAYANDPATWIRHACIILDRITPTLYTDCHTTLSGHPKDITPTETNANYLAAHDQPLAAHPALRRATLTNPDNPKPQREAIAIWTRYINNLNTCQAILPPWAKMSKPTTPRMVSWLLHRLHHTATNWETQPGTRPDDFRPVLQDTAHTLKHIILTDLAGWTTPRTIGTTACTNAGIADTCKISPVHAKGLCLPCYDRQRYANTNR